MKRILISDTHFGVRNNSITWMTHQVDFIHKQLIPFINDLRKHTDEEIVLYHLGDVFDSRSSINPLIASNIREAFIKLNTCVDRMFIIGGNHDYYSPADDNVNSIDIALHDEHNFHPTVITKDFDVYNGDLFVPWYKYDDAEEIHKMIKTHNIRNVFCHADLTHIDVIHKAVFNKVNVYSGHIHTPCNEKNLHTLGSTYALTFADCNADRGFYVLGDDSFDFYPNKYTIKFWRIWDEHILSYNIKNISKDDYVELYVKQSELLNDVFVNKMKEFTTKIHNCVIIPRSDKVNESCDEEIVNYDIVDMCKRSIPEELRSKFNIILDKVNKDLTN